MDKTQEEWDFGFDYIEENGPKDNVRNKQLRWVTMEISRQESPITPIYKWPAVLVKKSLRNLSQDGVLAQVHELWPRTLFDVDVRLLRALAPLFPKLEEKAIGFHGVPGAGKTPVARSIAMALSRYYINRVGRTGQVRPSFRQACEFDFFSRPAWLDLAA